MKRTTALILAIMIPSTAQADNVDIALQLGVTATLLADWHQTRRITANCLEANPIMGRCGEKLSPDIYFPVAIVAHATLARLLPRPYGRILQGLTIGKQLHTVGRNWSYGYTIQF